MNIISPSLKVVFMGTPEFAVASLDAISDSRHTLSAVVTVPDKPAGRGRKITSSAVKMRAEEKSIPVLQPVKLSEPQFIEQLTLLSPDVIVVVAFRMLPVKVWQIPVQGTFNLHASLLPQYRGAAPISRAIINGEQISGVTTFFIDHKIDTGSIIMQEPLVIGPDETAGELHDRMMVAGADLVVRTLDLIAEGKADPLPQRIEPGTKLHAAPKIFKEETPIDWGLPARVIHNKIRGFSPVPAASTTLSHPTRGLYTIRLFRSHLLPAGDSSREHPALLTDGRSHLHISLPDALLSIDEVQLEGRKRMPVSDFLRGFPLDNTWKVV
jgi:methionyl-tRNA formyltransferase